MRLIKHAAVVSIVVLTSCGPSIGLVTVPLPAEPSVADIHLVDARPNDQRSSHRTYPGAGFQVYNLGDDNFSPDSLSVLRAMLKHRLSERLTGKTVIIRSFKVSFSNNPKVSGRDLGFATASGGLIGGAAVLGIENARGNRLVFCELVIEIEGHVYKDNEMLPTSQENAEKRIVEIIQNTVATVARDANSLGGGLPF